MDRNATWAEPNCRKIFKQGVDYLDPSTGSPVRKTWWTSKLPAHRKNRTTKRRERLMRIRLEDGSAHEIPCRLTIAPKKAGGRVTARMTIGRRRIQVTASSLRTVWRPTMMAVEALLKREPDIRRLIDKPRQSYESDSRF